MKWLYSLILLTFLLSSSLSEETSSENNEIDPKQAVRNLDPSIRQALLRVIDNLEKRVAEEDEYEDEETSTGNDDLVDEDIKSGHNLLKSLLDIVASQKKYIDNPNSTFELANLLEKSALQANNHQSERNLFSDDSNEVINEKRDIDASTSRTPFTPTQGKIIPIIKVEPTKQTTTTSTTTTTTTPKPTHNEDGENIELVDKQDIKIFEAPLITAFTVKQDEKGSDKEIIPIFEPPPRQASDSIPEQSPQIPSAQTRPAIDSSNSNTVSSGILLPTPLPISPSQTGKSNNPQSVPIGHTLTRLDQIKRQRLPNAIKAPFDITQPEYSVFPARQSLPLSPVITPQAHSINDFLLERQRQLEQQIIQLQFQARHQQDQILLQQQLLIEQQRKQFIEPEQSNQVKATKTSTTNVTIRPSLEVISSVTHSPRFEYSVEQQLPLRESIPFRPVFDLPPSRSRLPALIQIEPSNQINFNQESSIQTAPTIPVPLEASVFQHLPQRSYQTFNLLPTLGPLNQNHFTGTSKTLASSSDQNLSRTRHFRQEAETGNFGFNNVFEQDYLRPPPFAAGPNHGIGPFTPQSLPFSGQFGGFF